jgi:hypothetical protein
VRSTPYKRGLAGLIEQTIIKAYKYVKLALIKGLLKIFDSEKLVMSDDYSIKGINMPENRVEELAQKVAAQYLRKAIAEQGRTMLEAPLPEGLRSKYPDLPPLEEFQVVERRIGKTEVTDQEGYLWRTFQLAEVFKREGGWVDEAVSLDDALEAMEEAAGEVPENAYVFDISRRIIGGAAYIKETGEIVRVLNIQDRFNTAARVESFQNLKPDFRSLPRIPGIMVPKDTAPEIMADMERHIIEQLVSKLEPEPVMPEDDNDEPPSAGGGWEPPPSWEPGR